MGLGNFHISQTFDFDRLEQVALKYGVWYSEDLQCYFGYAEFYGRDRNGTFAYVAQDGDSTVEARAGKNDQSNVPVSSLRMLLQEFGFQVDGSVWHKQIPPPSTNLPKEDPGYVYLLRMDGTRYYKVGKSRNTASRIKQIGVLLPKPVTLVYQAYHPYMSRYEEVIHKDYAIYHSHGEWFELDEKRANELVEFLQAIDRTNR